MNWHVAKEPILVIALLMAELFVIFAAAVLLAGLTWGFDRLLP